MLVITRKTNEGIIIDDNIEIVLLEVGKDKVKIGIDAPREVKIVRKEIYSTEQQNKQATEAPSLELIKEIFKGKRG